jgi:HSP20 family molecular chaperone IbpA
VRVEDYVEDDTYVLRAELPGVDPERDVSVTMHGETLTIDGERREETRTKQRREFYYGAFRRTLTLPSGTNAEDIEAAYTDGVLEVRVPLRTAGSATPRRIPVTG